MAINGRFGVSMDDVFSAGAFVVGDVEAVRDFEKSTAEKFAQAKDKETASCCGRYRCWTLTKRHPGAPRRCW